MLSPYLRHRLVTETELLDAVLARHSLEKCSKFVDEVFWRAYFKGWLEHRPTVWSAYRGDTAQLVARLDTDAGLRERYESAVGAMTGIDCFDAWSAELVRTGYLHNHARMWFASIWTFTLGLPWQLGADFFYRHLLDGDPASNTLGWRWVCGLHTKGKTYLARASNIAKYTDGRFDPSGQLARNAEALTEDAEHELQPLPDVADCEPGDRYGLFMTEEDLCPQSLGLNRLPQRILGAVATAARSPLPVGEAVTSFASRAVQGAVDRAAAEFDVPGELAPPPGDDWGALLAAWAAQHDLDAIVTAYAPTGPVAEKLANARDALDGRGVRLLQVRRRYDELAWPHATRGFFKLKSKIPALLSRAGIAA